MAMNNIKLEKKKQKQNLQIGVRKWSTDFITESKSNLHIMVKLLNIKDKVLS